MHQPLTQHDAQDHLLTRLVQIPTFPLSMKMPPHRPLIKQMQYFNQSG